MAAPLPQSVTLHARPRDVCDALLEARRHASGVPAKHRASIARGWRTYYWTPPREMFG